MTVLKCVDNLDFMAKYQDNYFNLICTSPPYNIPIAYGKRMPFDCYLKQMRKVIKECDRVLNSTGAIIWQVGNYVDKDGSILPLDVYFLPMFLKLGYKLRNRVALITEFGQHSKHRLSGRWECFLWLTKSDNYTFNLDEIRIPQLYPGKKAYKGPNAGNLSSNPLGKNPGDHWKYNPVRSNHPEKVDHPCAFPLDIVFKWIKAFSNISDKVLDPFMGVGSIPISAKALGRKGYGCDLKQDYVDIAVNRLQQLKRGELKARINGETILLHMG